MNNLIKKFLLVSLFCLPCLLAFTNTPSIRAGEEDENFGIEPEVYIKPEYEEQHSTYPKTHTSSTNKTILQSVVEAKTAIKANDLDKAEKIVDQILTVNSSNRDALVLKDNIRELKHMDHISEIQYKDYQERLKTIEELEERSIPYTETMRFPTGEDSAIVKKRTIPDITERFENSKDNTEKLRLIPDPKAPLPKKIENALNTYISIEFYETSLRDIIAFIQEKIDNINIIVEKTVPDAILSIKLKDVPVYVVLKHLLPEGINYEIEDDIIVIANELLELRVYDVRDLLINLGDRSSDGGGDSGGGGGGAGGGAGESRTPYARVQALMELITAVIAPDSWSPQRGRITTREDKPGDLIVVNEKQIHKEIEDILASMRSTQHLQVNIEARFIQMSDKFLEDIGIELKNASITRPSGEGTGLTFGVDTSSAGAPSISSGLDLTYSILRDYQVDILLNAVQESSEAETLTSPRITLSNTQRGSIRVINEISYVASYEIISQVPQPVIDIVNDGTIFDVRPVISTDRKHVFLEVHPIITKVILESLPFNVAVPFTGSQETTFQTLTLTIEQPLVSIQELSVTVDVPDRGTLMIGGLGTTEKTTKTTGVPILSKIPIIKRLFSRESEVVDRQNIVIILKPTIIIREEIEDLKTSKISNDKSL